MISCLYFSACKILASLSNFLVCKFSVNGQFLQIFRLFARKSMETVNRKRKRKICSPRNSIEKLIFYSMFIYQYISILAIFIYTVSWKYKRDYLHDSVDILFYIVVYITHKIRLFDTTFALIITKKIPIWTFHPFPSRLFVATHLQKEANSNPHSYHYFRVSLK